MPTRGVKPTNFEAANSPKLHGTLQYGFCGTALEFGKDIGGEDRPREEYCSSPFQRGWIGPGAALVEVKKKVADEP